MEREGVDQRLVARLAVALEAREEVTRGGQALSHHFDFLPQLALGWNRDEEGSNGSVPGGVGGYSLFDLG